MTQPTGDALRAARQRETKRWPRLEPGSFDDAFREARAEGYGRFEWRGELHHTRRADDPEAASPGPRALLASLTDEEAEAVVALVAFSRLHLPFLNEGMKEAAWERVTAAVLSFDTAPLLTPTARSAIAKLRGERT